mgnify:CR=1 FL=1
MRIHIATDHAGLEFSEDLQSHLRAAGHEVIDHGPTSYDPLDDYPSFCINAAIGVVTDQAAGIECLGIVFGAVILISGATALVAGLLPNQAPGGSASAVGFLQNSLWWYVGAMAVVSVIVAGIRMARRFLATEALRPYFDCEELPGVQAQSDDELLDFARQRTHERRELDLRRLAEECLDLLRERFSRRAIRVVTELDPEPVRMIGDEGELQQVATNLLLNAVDALAEGGTITVAVHRAGDRARLVVTDTGPGILPEHLGRHTLAKFRRVVGVHQDLKVGVGVHVDKAGGDYPAPTVYGLAIRLDLSMRDLRDCFSVH